MTRSPSARNKAYSRPPETCKWAVEFRRWQCKIWIRCGGHMTEEQAKAQSTKMESERWPKPYRFRIRRLNITERN